MGEYWKGGAFGGVDRGGKPSAFGGGGLVMDGCEIAVAEGDEGGGRAGRKGRGWRDLGCGIGSLVRLVIGGGSCIYDCEACRCMQK